MAETTEGLARIFGDTDLQKSLDALLQACCDGSASVEEARGVRRSILEILASALAGTCTADQARSQLDKTVFMQTDVWGIGNALCDPLLQNVGIFCETCASAHRPGASKTLHHALRSTTRAVRAALLLSADLLSLARLCRSCPQDFPLCRVPALLRCRASVLENSNTSEAEKHQTLEDILRLCDCTRPVVPDDPGVDVEAAITPRARDPNADCPEPWGQASLQWWRELCRAVA